MFFIFWLNEERNIKILALQKATTTWIFVLAQIKLKFNKLRYMMWKI